MFASRCGRMNCMSLKFLKPRIGNVLLTLVVISLPLLREQVQLPTGGYEIARYRPVFLLTSYLQMQDWYPFLLMIGFTLAVYVGASIVVAITSKLLKKRSSV